MREIFVSYRRRPDYRAVTEHIYDRLKDAFGKDAIFKDVHSIPGAADWRQELRRALNQAVVTLVIIGPDWATMSNASGTGLADPGDPVRMEVELSLQRQIPVFPVLVFGAAISQVASLPSNLAQLQYRNVREVHDHPYFDFDMDRLIKDISQYVKRRGTEADKGLLALQLRYYALAIQLLAKARELHPTDGAIAFTYALALLQGRSPGLVQDKGEIVRIEEVLKTAMSGLKAREIVAFWGALKEEYWVQRWGYAEEHEDARQLFQFARRCPSDRELFGLLKLVQPAVMVKYADYFR